MGVDTHSIAANREAIRERIRRAAQRSGRQPGEITLVAVSKTFPAESIRQAYVAGVRHFGENRVQEWESKRAALADLDATWHLVGHLQTNKAARAVRAFHTVDSLDSLDLAQKLDRAVAANDTNARIAVLIEVRLGDESAKSGVSESELYSLADGVLALPHLDLRGLMCIPPFCEDHERARQYFRKLRELRDAVSERLGVPLPELSMGMSHDFEVAIEEGATQVRLGTAIFGSRTGAP